MAACEFFKYCIDQGWDRDKVLTFIELSSNTTFIEDDIKLCDYFVHK